MFKHLFKTPLHQYLDIMYPKPKTFKWIYNKNAKQEWIPNLFWDQNIYLFQSNIEWPSILSSIIELPLLPVICHNSVLIPKRQNQFFYGHRQRPESLVNLIQTTFFEKYFAFTNFVCRFPHLVALSPNFCFTRTAQQSPISNSQTRYYWVVTTELC